MNYWSKFCKVSFSSGKPEPKQTPLPLRVARPVYLLAPTTVKYTQKKYGKRKGHALLAGLLRLRRLDDENALLLQQRYDGGPAQLEEFNFVDEASQRDKRRTLQDPAAAVVIVDRRENVRVAREKVELFLGIVIGRPFVRTAQESVWKEIQFGLLWV